MTHSYDVVILGGGPGGTTAGTLIKKYAPSARVAILEREQFPRDHIGESQLPVIGAVLEEMGCWDKVEAANFPIKIGATYRWGTTDDLWNFEFLPWGELQPMPRPGKFEGQRTQTAFQVDRSIYDQILLNHARECGCEVFEQTRVTQVGKAGDTVTSIVTDSGDKFTASYFVDASGASGIIRRSMGVEVESPTSLRNIAIWDYWQNATWAVEIGVGGTRIQVMSLGFGWIWFIPLGPTRTSVGLVVPAEYFKSSGKTVKQIYEDALQSEPRIWNLMRDATSEGKLQTTNDWSFVADRLAGENWFLVGDACGFADPILSAGMTLAHAGAREVAYSIIALMGGSTEGDLIRESYDENQRRRVKQHIAFADYWYGANECFTDLKVYTSKIAKDAGIDLDAESAFQWLGTGGFANEGTGEAGIGTFSVSAIKMLTNRLSNEPITWRLNDLNEFKLNLVGARQERFATYRDGVIHIETLYRRGESVLPLYGTYKLVFEALRQEQDLMNLIRILRSVGVDAGAPDPNTFARHCFLALEAMISEGWVKARANSQRPFGQVFDTLTETPMVYTDSADNEVLSKKLAESVEGAV